MKIYYEIFSFLDVTQLSIAFDHNEMTYKCNKSNKCVAYKGRSTVLLNKTLTNIKSLKINLKLY